MRSTNQKLAFYYRIRSKLLKRSSLNWIRVKKSSTLVFFIYEEVFGGLVLSPFLHHQPFFGGAMVLWMVLHRQFNTINYVLFWYLRRNSSIFTEKALFCIFYNENYKRDLYRDLNGRRKNFIPVLFCREIRKNINIIVSVEEKPKKGIRVKKWGLSGRWKKYSKMAKRKIGYRTLKTPEWKMNIVWQRNQNQSQDKR